MGGGGGGFRELELVNSALTDRMAALTSARIAWSMKGNPQCVMIHMT